MRIPILLLCLFTHLATAKIVTIRWKPIPEAVYYELQIKHGEQRIYRKIMEATLHRWEGKLPTGVFTYQLRTIDRYKRAGAWTSPENVAVLPSATTLRSPPNGDKRTSLKRLSTVGLTWDHLGGVRRYLVKVTLGGTTIKQVETDTIETYLTDLAPGSYAWTVTPIVEAPKQFYPSEGSQEISSNQATETKDRWVGPTSAPAVFSIALDSDAELWSAHSYLAITMMLAPYRYEVTTPASNTPGITNSTAPSSRFSGQYRFHHDWRLSGAFEDSRFHILGREVSRQNFELFTSYRLKLALDPIGPHLYPSLGMEWREHFLITDTSGSIQREFQSVGPSFGFTLAQGVTQDIGVELRLRTYFPLLLLGGQKKTLSRDQSTIANASIGLAGSYWLNEHWGFGMGASYDHQSLAYQTGSLSASEKILQNSWLFFGHALYRL